VTKLADKVENALDETRMLVLGAQVLLGFAFQSVFTPVFDRLPVELHALKVVSQVLMLLALGLLLAPTAFHQIVEGGNDTERVTDFTGRIASLALLPFALGLGVDVYLSSSLILGAAAAWSTGLAATAFALAFWYGLEWFVRRRDERLGRARKEPHRVESTDLANKIKQVLTEARVVLPGAQALLGFQLAALLTDAFEKLPKTSQYVHLAGLGLIGVCIVLLMAPAAFHRIVERGEDSERLHQFASAMVLSALVPLALGVSADFYVVATKVLDSTGLGLALAGVALVFFYSLWFGLTLLVRRRDQSGRGTAPAGPA
jgi:hypothetical protein